MGGLGSGAGQSRMITVEGTPFLDVNALRRKGGLTPNARTKGTLGWATWYETVTAYFDVTLGSEGGYMFLKINGEPDQCLPLISTPAPFGGRRWWWKCPYRNLLVTRLYRPPGGRQFASRKAWKLVYSTTRMAPHERALHRAQALRQRLGGDPSLDAPWPSKPQWMRWPTYERHLAELERLEEITETYLAGLIERLSERDRLTQDVP